MPRICGVCGHERNSEINAALVAGEPYRTIAKRFGASPAAVFRHGKEHVPVAMVQAKAARVEIQADTLFDRLRAINRETQDILREARGAQNHVVALQAIGRVEKQLELEARLLGELDDSIKMAVGIHVAPQSVAPERPRLADLSPFQLEKLKQLTVEANLAGVKVELCDG